MHVDVTLEERDYDALGAYLLERGEKNRRRRIRYVAGRGAVVLVFVVVILNLLQGGSEIPRLALTALLYVLLMGAYLTFVWFQTGAQLQRRVAEVVAGEKRKPLSLRRYSITEGGLALRGDAESAEAPWGTVADIDQTDQHIFVFGDREFPGVIPKRAFSSEGQAQQFYGLAREYWAKNRI